MPPTSCCNKIKEKTFFFGKYKNILKKLLTNLALRDKIHHVPNGTYALVAQLDRVTDYESYGTTSKITGKMILEAIRQMDAEERRELTRVLFA